MKSLLLERGNIDRKSTRNRPQCGCAAFVFAVVDFLGFPCPGFWSGRELWKRNLSSEGNPRIPYLATYSGYFWFFLGGGILDPIFLIHWILYKIYLGVRRGALRTSARILTLRLQSLNWISRPWAKNTKNKTDSKKESNNDSQKSRKWLQQRAKMSSLFLISLKTYVLEVWPGLSSESKNPHLAW